MPREQIGDYLLRIVRVSCTNLDYTLPDHNLSIRFFNILRITIQNFDFLFLLIYKEISDMFKKIVSNINQTPTFKKNVLLPSMKNL